MTRSLTTLLTTDRTGTGGRTATRGLLLLAMALAAFAIVPAVSGAATKFGAKLTPDVQPSNAGDGHLCEPSMGDPCTRVSMEAYGRPNGGHKAPKDGVIKKIRIIAQSEGSFRLQLARARAEQEKAKVTYTGERLRYDGQTGPDDGTYDIESFRVDVPVEKGDHLAIKTRRTSMLRCSSGGPNQLLFQPPLAVGGPFETADATDGCWLLMEAVYR